MPDNTNGRLVDLGNRSDAKPGTIGHMQDTVALLIKDYLDWGAHYVDGSKEGVECPTREEAERVLAHFGLYAKTRLCVTLR